MAAITLDPSVRQRLEDALSVPPLLPKDLRKGQTVKNVKAGGYLNVHGQIHRVDGVNRYQDSEGYEWFELCLWSLREGRAVYLEWEEDDELELWIQTEQVKDLGAIGTTPEALVDFDDREAGSLNYRGTVFRYEESDKALFFKGNAGKGESYYYWDFIAPDGKTAIGVERWSDGHSVSIMEKVSLTSAEILLVGGEA